jgi:hypothetical protein
MRFVGFADTPGESLYWPFELTNALTVINLAGLQSKLVCSPLFDHSLILVVRTDPNPDEVRAILHSDGAVIDADSRRPEIPDSFEMKRRVCWVLF